MKKYFIVFFNIFLVLLITSCQKTQEPTIEETKITEEIPTKEVTPTKTPEPTIIETPEPDIPTITKPMYDYTCITTDKTTYSINEKITVYLHNTESSDLLAITEYGKEPNNQFILLKRQVKDTTEQVFNPSKLNGAGDYTIFLYKNSEGVIDLIDIHIDDEDTNNYKISNATIDVSSNNLSSMITVNTVNTNELTYRLYWAKDGNRLTDYMAIKTLKSSNLDTFNIELPNNLYMPNEANQIEIAVVEGVTESYFINLEDKLTLPESKYLFTFNAVSDLHIQSKSSSTLFNAHLKRALKDIYSSDSLAIFAVGDIINNSEESNYEYFKSLLEEVKTPNAKDIYYAVGNHEYMYQTDMNIALGMFKEQFGLDCHYYSVELNGYKFIVLGSDDISSYGVMNSIQIEWLRSELAKTDKNKPTFIFMHQGLKDTVAGTLETELGQQDHGFGSSRNTLRSILKNYPNAVVFTGHSHYSLEEYKTFSYGNGLDASFANCGSMAYLNGYNTEDLGGSEGYYVEVYEDYILLRGKEFIYDKWIGGAQFYIPLHTSK